MPDTETITLPSGHTATLRTEVLYGDDMDLEGLASQIAASGQMHQTGQANGRTSVDIPQPTTDTGLTISGVPAPGGQTASFSVAPEALAAQVEASKFFPLCALIESWDFDLPVPGVLRGLPRTVRGHTIPGQILGLDTESLRMIPRSDGAKLQIEAKRIWDAAHPDFSAVPTEGAESPFTSSSASEP